MPTPMKDKLCDGIQARRGVPKWEPGIKMSLTPGVPEEGSRVEPQK